MKFSRVQRTGNFIIYKYHMIIRISWIIDRKDVSIFPKNYILLRMIEKKKAQLQIANESSAQLKHLPSSYADSGSSSPTSKHESFDRLPGKEAISPLNRPSQMGENVIFDPNTMCREHCRKLEVICMDHKCRICTNCALFGSHKNHDVRGEEEILKEITMRAEFILDMFQIIDQNQNKIFDVSYLDRLNTKMKSKYEQLARTIKQKFEVIILINNEY